MPQGARCGSTFNVTVLNSDAPLWTPSDDRRDGSVLREFETHLQHTHGLSFDTYRDLHTWSVDARETFWAEVWHFAQVKASRPAERVLEHGERFPGARWFPGAQLNFAENLLRHKGADTAIVSYLENGTRRAMTFDRLRGEVARLAAALTSADVRPGDRVAGYLPNIPETVVAMLATASIGAVWSSCSPDFGVNGVLDRLGQIQPKVLFACDGYFYNGKAIDCRDRLDTLAGALPSLQQIVLVPVLAADPGGHTPYRDFLAAEQAEPRFAQLPFDHQLYVLYSSGTTGTPKCIVHGAGGTLLQHMKEHLLHVGLRKGDALFYFTTCGWMMWNWLVSALATGSTIVLYDGSPFHPGPEALWRIVEQEHVSVFGTSAKYLSALEKAAYRPADEFALKRLRTVLSTGSPLSSQGFDYVYRDIKQDVCLSSISGGTDIVSCFVLGNECLPVRAGEIQCAGLGMDVAFFDEDGSVLNAEDETNAKGELVCRQPFPSTPLGFWGDDSGAAMHDAYFARFPGVWAHGDYGAFTRHGGVVIYGRSDAVLNPGGVRIGTAEIYRQVEAVDEVVDALCIGQRWQEDERIVLFVVLREGVELDEALIETIKQTIRQGATPRHVPAKVVAVADLPRTLSGKIAELAVRAVVHGEIVKNTDALANPECLTEFAHLEALQT